MMSNMRRKASRQASAKFRFVNKAKSRSGRSRRVSVRYSAAKAAAAKARGMTAGQGAAAAVDRACNHMMSVIMKTTRKRRPTLSTGFGRRGSLRFERQSAKAAGSMTSRFSQKFMRQPA